jgi:hypothetical protein
MGHFQKYCLGGNSPVDPDCERRRMTLAYRGSCYRLAVRVFLRNFNSGVRLSFLVAVVLFILFAAPSRAAEAQKPPTTPTTTNSKVSRESETAPPPTPTEQAIPLPQIADRAKELNERLAQIYQQLSSTEETLPSEAATQARADDIRGRALFVDTLVNGLPTSLELRDEDQHWVSLNRQFTSERKFLTSRATALEEQIQFLEVQLLLWQTTLDQIRQMRGKWMR